MNGNYPIYTTPKMREYIDTMQAIDACKATDWGCLGDGLYFNGINVSELLDDFKQIMNIVEHIKFNEDDEQIIKKIKERHFFLK